MTIKQKIDQIEKNNGDGVERCVRHRLQEPVLYDEQNHIHLLALNTLNAAGWALGGYKVINAIKLRFVVYW
jgi:hypothetical protein